MRAIARRMRRMLDGSAEVSAAALKRRSNSSRSILPSSKPSSSSVLPRISPIFIAVLPAAPLGARQAPDHLDLDGQLVSDALEGQLGLVLGHAADLEHR